MCAFVHECTSMLGGRSFLELQKQFQKIEGPLHGSPAGLALSDL